MPQLLVSVRNLDEAAAARLAGVDIVDLKEPGAGALGAIAGPERQRIVNCWNQLPAGETVPQLSLALGELAAVGNPGWTLPDSKPESQFRYAKVGLAGVAENAAAGNFVISDWRARWRELALQLPQPTTLVAAAYADASAARAPEPEEVLELALDAGSEVFLLDTFGKQSGSVFELLPTARLARLRALACGRIEFALAGSIRREHQSSLRELQPEIVALRGAVCEAGRNSPLCPQRLRQWRELTRLW